MVLKSVRLIIEFAIGAVIGVVILGGLIIWRLSGEPVSLAFLTPYLEDALKAKDGSFTTHLDDTQLTWAGWDRALDIRLIGVRAIKSDGEVIASVPEMGVGLSFRALLRGDIAPTSLEVFRPKLRIVRGKEGGFDIAAEDAGPAAGDILERLLNVLIAPPNTDEPTGYLTSVEITDADLTLVDEEAGTSWQATDTDVVLARDDKGITGSVSLDLALGETVAEMSGHIGYDRSARTLDAGISFNNVSPAEVAKMQKIGGGLEGFAVPLAGTVTATMNLDGDVEALGFDITGGQGKIVLPEFYKEPLPVTSLTLNGRVEENLARIVLKEFHADLGGPGIGLKGTVFSTGADVTAQGEAEITGMPVDSLMRYWPEGVAVNPREWIAEHLSKGRVRDTRAAFAVTAPKGNLDDIRLNSIAGNFTAEGITVDYLTPMIPASNVAGRATFTASELDINITNAELLGIRATEGTVAITGLNVEDQFGTIEMVITGPLSDIMAVLDTEPVEATKFLGVTPQEIGGLAAVRMRFKLPLLKDLKVTDMEIGAAANTTGASIAGIALGQDLTDGALTIKMNADEITAEGTARLGGVPASLNILQSFSQEAPTRSRFAVTASPSDGDLGRLGFSVAPYVTGTIPLNLVYVVNNTGRGELGLTAELTQAAIAVEELKWSKPEGTAGTGRVALVLQDDVPVAIREYDIAAGTLRATGSGTFTAPADGGKARLERIEFTQLAFGRTDIAGTMSLREGGGFDLDIKGPQIDAADYFSLEPEKEPEKKETEPPYRIKAATEYLWLGPELRVVNAKLDLDHADDRMRKLYFEGGMETTKGAKEIPSFRVTIDTEGDKRRVTAATGDAGRFLLNFGIFDNMLGGALTLAGTIDDTKPTAPFAGNLLIKNYRVTQVPVLAKILTAASLTGVFNLLQGEGIGFSDLKAELKHEDDVLTVTNGRAYGASIGLTMQGKINLKADTIEANGTVVPAYFINAALGGIPIVGDILTGGDKGGGIFAANYRMSGPIADPKVNIDPLSALAPGFLRNIFGAFDGTATSDTAAKPPAEQTDTAPAEQTETDITPQSGPAPAPATRQAA